jgi:formamidopyrimidine-DNA glycosylase
LPEGPEVKLSADLIRPLVTDRIIAWLDFPKTSRYHNSSPDGFSEFAKHFSYQDKNYACKVEDVQCKGKFMYWTIADNWYMFVTYGMTGQFSPQQGKHPCMKIRLDDAPLAIYFNDPRHFGTIKFTNKKSDLDAKLKELGWDPLSQDLEKHKEFLFKKIRNTNKPIGQIMLDQKVFAGSGNYLRAEALYQAKISPWRCGGDMSKDEVLILCQTLSDVMHQSYSQQGATISTYSTPYGEEGKYSSRFKVYGQSKDPSGNIIRKETTPEGRTIHWCPAIQI